MTETSETNDEDRDDSWDRAFRSFWRYIGDTEDLVHLTHEGLARTMKMPELFRILEEEDEVIAAAEWRADRARNEVDAGYPTLHAHSLLGLWGALESLVEDVFLAALEEDATMLASEAFAKVKVPVGIVVAEQAGMRRAILTEISRATGSDLAQGVSKFERILEPIGMGGPVPKRVRDALFEAQQVRNVWAHRGGVADARYVERCPHLGFRAGDRLNMDAALFGRLMHATHMYGALIQNRHRDKLGKQRANAECIGYEGVLSEIPAYQVP